MHILILASEYPTSYSRFTGIFYKDQAEALAKENQVGAIGIIPIGIKAIVKTKKWNFSYSNFIENKVNTYLVQYPNIIRNVYIDGYFRLKIFKFVFKKYIAKHGLPEIIHLHSFRAGEMAIWIKKEYKINFVVTEHSSAFSRNLISNSEYKLIKKIFTESINNIAVSEKFAELLETEFQVPFTYIPNIVPSIFFKDFNKYVKPKSADFHFVNVAFLDKNKNQSLLLQAFHHAFNKNPKYKLTIIGDGPEYNNLCTIVSELGLSDCVALFGKADREEVKTVLSGADAFVLSSYYETFGVVLIEAMACGLPVISTKCGGPESIIKNERLGLMCEVDLNSLSEAMIKLVHTDFDKDYIRNYALENFSAEAITRQLIQVYEKTAFRL